MSTRNISFREPWLWALIVLALVMVCVLAATDWFHGSIAPDTSGYFFDLTWPGLWEQPRHPLYAVLLRPFGPFEGAAQMIAIAQMALHILSCIVLYCGARWAGIGGADPFSLAGSLLFAQVIFQYAQKVVPEGPAISLFAIGLAATLAATREEKTFWRLLLPIVVVIAVACILRPIALPAVITLPLLYLTLTWRSGGRGVVFRSAAMAIALAAPLLAQSSVRYAAVGDFNVVSFGGYQMSAMAAYMLDSKIVDSMAADSRNTARDILAARVKAEAENSVNRTPLNSSNERSFLSGTIGYFDIYARTYDALLTRIMQVRALGKNWVPFNARLMRFSFSTLWASPLRWGAWIAGATSRFVGHLLVTNVTLIACSLLFLFAWVFRLFRRGGLDPLKPNDIGAVTIIASIWCITWAPLAVLITTPGARYIDTAGALLPAIPFAAALAGFGRSAPVSVARDGA